MTKQKEDVIEFIGVVKELLPNANFRIELDNGHEVIGYTSGKMRKNRIKVMLGDYVRVQMTPYDLDRGRVTHRFKHKPSEEEINGENTTGSGTKHKPGGGTKQRPGGGARQKRRS